MCWVTFRLISAPEYPPEFVLIRDSDINFPGSSWGKGPGGAPGRCRIVYASRTHSQLAQVIGEFQRSPYQNAASVILASRDQVEADSISFLGLEPRFFINYSKTALLFLQ